MRIQLVRSSLVLFLALAGAAPAMATPLTTAAGPSPSPTVGSAPATAQGIIMRDGGICDPIRHMGC